MATKRESIAEIKKRAGRVARALAKLYPAARISLDFETPWQCLAATILSAQSTDAGVNRVTPQLFREYPDARAMAAADPRHVEEVIVRTGFFRQKTRALMGAARKIVEDYGGEVPSEMNALVKIPGVGRKTANVILGHIFGKPGFVVDTHVRRLTYRLGFTKNTEPEKIEIDMQNILPPKDWTPFSMRLILHGRQICIARNPQCEICAIARDCPRIGLGKSPRKASPSQSG
ncbi:MAG: endonuclease III [Candidatus Binatus sp.]